MANSGKVARRYARAIFELTSGHDVESVRDQLFAFARSWRQVPAIRTALLNPAFPLIERQAALTTIAERVGVMDGRTKNLIALLLQNRRITIVEEVARELSKMVDELRRLLSLEITSAFALSPDEQQSIRNRLAERFGQMVSIVWHVDQKLIGGMQIKCGDRLLDHSVLGTLDRMRAQLAS